MKKRLIKSLLVCFLVLLTFTTISCKKNQDKVSSFPEIVNDLKSYKLTKKEVNAILSLGGNLDNETTYFVLASKNEFEKLNLLPLDLYNLV
mgnify:CR=1 FL=1